MRRHPAPYLLLACLFVAACDESPLRPSAVRDVTWKLESIERAGAATVTIPNPERFTLRLEADGRANAGADCNTCNGRYTLDGASIAFTGFACTRAFCGTTLDTAYASALGEVRAIVVSETALVLTGPGVTLRYRN